MSLASAETVYFADRAKEFVVWCHAQHEGKLPRTFQAEALQQLSLLYASAWLLPQDETRTSLPEAPSVTLEHRQKIAEHFKTMPFQYYWEMIAPAKMEDGDVPMCADLLEDLLDIYADLAAGLWHYEQGDVEAAVVEWRLRFAAHWGAHAVSAMHALHLFAPKEDVPADDLL